MQFTVEDTQKRIRYFNGVRLLCSVTFKS